MFDPIGCAKIALGVPRVDLATLLELKRVLSKAGMPRESPSKGFDRLVASLCRLIHEHGRDSLAGMVQVADVAERFGRRSQPLAESEAATPAMEDDTVLPIALLSRSTQEGDLDI
jgi:hypothetical protein